MTTARPPATKLTDIVGAYQGIILDIFGVVHDGVSAYPHAVEALVRMRARGIRICLLSNSPRRSRDVAVRLGSMGIGQDLYQGLITSGEMVYEALAATVPIAGTPVGGRYLHLGPAELSGLLHGLDLKAVKTVAEAGFLLATGCPDGGDNDAIAPTLVAARTRNLPMVCANPDLEVFIGSSRIVCAGTIASRYEALGGSVVRYGKPYLPAYVRALQVLDLPAAHVLAIGDSLDTDILGASRARIDSALVMTGIHREHAGNGSGPDWQALNQLYRLHGAEPTFVLQSLAWPA